MPPQGQVSESLSGRTLQEEAKSPSTRLFGASNQRPRFAPQAESKADDPNPTGAERGQMGVTANTSSPPRPEMTTFIRGRRRTGRRRTC
jgi:hypothetical protein